MNKDIPGGGEWSRLILRYTEAEGDVQFVPRQEAEGRIKDLLEEIERVEAEASADGYSHGVADTEVEFGKTRQ